MSRHSDIRNNNSYTYNMPLPKVGWQKIGCNAPQKVPVDYKSPDAPLPNADVVIITWTSAEWSAFDHVFLNSDTQRFKNDYYWKKEWYQYSHNVPDGFTSKSNPLWGFYQMVSVESGNGQKTTILLFKSDSHLAHPPYLSGLSQMTQQIIDEVKPKVLLSIGTAGGDRSNQYLGDTVVTNSGYLEMKLKENKDAPCNHNTYTSNWFPESNLYDSVTKSLLFLMDQVVTYDELNYLLEELHNKIPDSSKYQLSDLLNAQITPQDLGAPNIQLLKNIPLLTTDFYYTAASETSDDKYAVLEMDDTVIGYIAEKNGIPFSFVRNISDPVIRSKDDKGNPIPSNVRDEWSSLIYEDFGFYTSFNGALTAWAAVTGSEI